MTVNEGFILCMSLWVVIWSAVSIALSVAEEDERL